MTTSEAKTGIIELARGVYARIYPESRTNYGFIVGDDAVLVIDTKQVPSVARELIAEIRRVTDKPVRYVINTHFHWDHCFGNQEFPGAVIIGHAECRRELEEYGEEMRQDRARRNPEHAEELQTVQIRPPELTFTDRLALYFGGRRLDLLYFGYAHTRGDIFIYLPDDRVLYTGDVVLTQRAPAMMDGFPRSWVPVAERLLSLDVEQIAPGHSFIGTKQDLIEGHAFVADLWKGAEQAFREGKSEEEAYKSLRLEERYGHWDALDRVQVGIARAYMELRGELL